MNFNNRVGHATAVGIYPEGRTSLGVEDLAGNVREWCADWYGTYGARSQTDPRGARAGAFRVLRGGGFDVNARLCRAAFRSISHPEEVGDFVGFRCVVVSSGELKD